MDGMELIIHMHHNNKMQALLQLWFLYGSPIMNIKCLRLLKSREAKLFVLIYVIIVNL